MNIADNIIKKPLEDLIPYANNPRQNDDAVDAVAASIQEFGFKVPIIIDNNSVIVTGHTRYKAAKKLKMSEVPCIIADDLTPAQVKAFRIIDNKVAEASHWDMELLGLELEDIDMDMTIFGFEDDIDDFDDGIEDDDYDLNAALEKASFVERGDLWHVGRHRLMCGDATNVEDVTRLMDGKKANLIVTDPPYGVSFKSTSGLTIQNDSMKDEEFYEFLFSAFKCMADVLEKGGAAYIFHADTEGLNFRRAFIDAGFHLAGVCIWVKNSLVLGRSDYQWQHEPVLYGFLQNGKHSWYADRKQTTIWNYDKPKRNENHPTSKPLDLIGYPIGNSSQENAVVIDFFGGSGSTMMACEQKNRNCYMMELDEKYASVILRRAVENGIDPDDIFVIRNGEMYLYSDFVKEVDDDGNSIE